MYRPYCTLGSFKRVWINLKPCKTKLFQRIFDEGVLMSLISYFTNMRKIYLVSYDIVLELND